MENLTEEQKQIVNGIMENIMNEDLQITPESELVNDFGIDSLDVIECIMDVEKAFDCSISDTSMEQVSTVQDFYDVLSSLINKS